MPLTDIVYPLGSGSKIDNLELRFSLRSIAKHGSNVGNIYVIGERPAFLNWSEKLIHIPFVETRGRYANVWEKAKMIARDERITETVLWMNDDFYIVHGFDAGKVPFFSRRGDIDKAQVKSSYQKTMRRTMEVLQNLGKTTHHFGTHQPCNFEKAKIGELCEALKDNIYQKYGMCFRTAYGNYFEVERTPQPTVLIKTSMPSIAGRFAVASHEDVNRELLVNELTKLYPEPSEF